MPCKPKFFFSLTLSQLSYPRKGSYWTLTNRSVSNIKGGCQRDFDAVIRLRQSYMDIRLGGEYNLDDKPRNVHCLCIFNLRGESTFAHPLIIGRLWCWGEI